LYAEALKGKQVPPGSRSSCSTLQVYSSNRLQAAMEPLSYNTQRNDAPPHHLHGLCSCSAASLHDKREEKAAAEVAFERALQRASRDAAQKKLHVARSALQAAVAAPSSCDNGPCTLPLQLVTSAHTHDVNGPGLGNDSSCSQLRVHLVVFFLSLHDHQKLLHATASNAAALRTLQPHNHTPPKHFEKFPSLNARTRAAPNAANERKSTVNHAGDHDRVETQHQQWHEHAGVLAPVHCCNARS
jgi:hypothetical protein